jgi:archaellum component FlaC
MVGAMSKQFIAGPLKSALETLIRERMPGLETSIKSLEESVKSLHGDIKRLEVSVHNEIRQVDAKVDGLKDEMLDRFDSMLTTVNEVSQKIIFLDGKLEGYMEAMGIRLNVTQLNRPIRKRRAS